MSRRSSALALEPLDHLQLTSPGPAEPPADVGHLFDGERRSLAHLDNGSFMGRRWSANQSPRWQQKRIHQFGKVLYLPVLDHRLACGESVICSVGSGSSPEGLPFHAETSDRGVSMAATMNERVHENRNENLHGRKKINSSFRADKTPADKGYEFRRAINGQLKGFMGAPG
jgi:hypothetical protein